ncbi:MAG: hypothetical protein KAW12_21465 [Candidatus Aminicenantes bacterium]|nr:hypothetical protein [Candidatus Aminicenantes bacterium]
MRYIKIVLLAGCVLAVNIFIAIQIQKSYNEWSLSQSGFSVKIMYADPFLDIIKYGSNEEGIDELMSVSPEQLSKPGTQEIKFFHPFSRTNVGLNFFLHLSKPLNYTVAKPLDVIGDSEFEIPFIGIENRKVFFTLRNFEGGGNVIHKRELEELSLKLPGDRMEMMTLAIEDVDGDGNKDLIWRICGGFLGLPRGFACHDPFSGKKKWEFLSGAIPRGFKILDIDRDGKNEIIFSLRAPHNGISYNGMNDDTSYVGVLNSSGKLIWMHETGGFYSDIYFDVGDINGNGKYELVTSRSCHRAVDPDPGEIKIYDLLSGKTFKKFTTVEGSFSQPYLVDVDDTPGMEVIVGDTAGIIRILDNNLKILKKVKTESVVSILGVDGFISQAPLIFASNRNSTFSIFDHRLKKLFSFKTIKERGYGDPILPVSNGKEKFFILNADRPYLISKNKPGLSKYRTLIFSNFSFFLFLILSFDFLVFLFLKEKKARKKSTLDQSIQPTSHTWIEMAIDLTHQIKNTLLNVLLKSENMRSAFKKKEYRHSLPDEMLEFPDTMLDDIKDLKMMSSFLMKLLQPQQLHLGEVKLNELIIGVVKKYTRILKDRIEFTQQFDSNLPTLQLDEEKFNEALSNIIGNAIEVLPNGGRIEIKTGFADKAEDQNEQEVLIQVSDNGPGIPTDKIKEIFKPRYSTKKDGSGFGLSISRKIIEAHGGRIDVESSVGVGAKFALYIPIDVPG